MSATKLIQLASTKGFAVSRKSRNAYQTHHVTAEGQHVTKDFSGTWSQFVAHVKSL